MRVEVIRIDGRHEWHEIHASTGSLRLRECRRLIGCDCADSVNLRDGRVMIVDDIGHQLNLPINSEATKLYHSVCRPGTTHQIVGDVVIAIDKDFA